MDENSDLTTSQLIDIIQQGDILRLMGEHHLNQITVDFMPPTKPLIRVRLDDDLEPVERTFKTRTLTFKLDSAMMGGVTYASLVLGDRVVIEPWRWESFEHLAQKKAVVLDSHGRKVV